MVCSRAWYAALELRLQRFTTICHARSAINIAPNIKECSLIPQPHTQSRASAHHRCGKPRACSAEATARALLQDGFFLDLDQPTDRAGHTSGHLSTVPVLCHVKRVILPNGTYILELNYMFFFAYSGPYVMLGKEKGAHDGDWEHVTVRCCPDSGELIAAYYSAHRHGDGTWVPAERVPLDNDTGRVLAFCALNGHGMYPKPRCNLRVFGLANDRTSSVGRRWSSRRCIVVVPPGQGAAPPLTVAALPEVRDRGARFRKRRSARPVHYQLGPPACGFNDGVVPVSEVEVEAQEMPFFLWNLKWGGSVSPHLQRWFQDAEHPAGSSMPRRLFAPCWKT